MANQFAVSDLYPETAKGHPLPAGNSTLKNQYHAHILALVSDPKIPPKPYGVKPHLAISHSALCTLNSALLRTLHS